MVRQARAAGLPIYLRCTDGRERREEGKSAFERLAPKRPPDQFHGG